MDGALAGARFAHFAALMLAFGMALFAAALAPAPLGPELAVRQRGAVTALAALALASALAWFYLVARAMAGEDFDAGALQDVALSTAFGGVWIAHVALLIALLALARARAGVVAGVAGLALASLALTGHADMQEGALGDLHRANDALHLVLTAGWLGGLAPFLFCLRLYAAAPERRDALAAMMRYSRAGHVAVPLVLLTGGLDAAMTTGLPPWRALTFYRVGVLVKLALFSAMTALALINRYRLAPQVGRRAGAARWLAAGAAGEIALALAALADVSVFATSDPL